jgi:hypothetical protein
MLAVLQVGLDHGPPHLVEQTAKKPVQQRGETGDRRSREQPARSKHAPCLAERVDPLLTLE